MDKSRASRINMRKLESQMRRRAAKPLAHKLEELGRSGAGRPVSSIAQQLEEIFREHRIAVSSESVLRMARRIHDGQGAEEMEQTGT